MLHAAQACKSRIYGTPSNRTFLTGRLDGFVNNTYDYLQVPMVLTRLIGSDMARHALSLPT